MRYVTAALAVCAALALSACTQSPSELPTSALSAGGNVTATNDSGSPELWALVGTQTPDELDQIVQSSQPKEVLVNPTTGQVIAARYLSSN